MKDAELIKFATQFRDGILGSQPSNWMCFAVCAPLQTLLNMSGVETELTEGVIVEDGYEISHTWLTLADGRILDPTADQFDILPAVYLGEKPATYLLT